MPSKQNAASVVTTAFGAGIVGKVCVLVSCVMQYQLLLHSAITRSEAQNNDARQRIITIASVFIVLSAQVFFLIWIYQAKKKVIALGMRGAEYSPGLSVGCFFIPFANLVFPFQSMRELWLASINPPQWREQRSSPLIGLWWAMWILNSLLPFAVLLFSKFSAGREAIAQTTLGLIACAALSIVSFVLTMFLARTISGQINQAESVVREPTNPPPLPPSPSLAPATEQP